MRVSGKRQNAAQALNRAAPLRPIGTPGRFWSPVALLIIPEQRRSARRAGGQNCRIEMGHKAYLFASGLLSIWGCQATGLHLPSR
jgi:hypothetical protein